MKKGIHPDYHPIKVAMTDGSEFVTQSTWGGEGERLQLVVDPKNHPAYTGEYKVMDAMGRIEKFARRYGIQGNKDAAPKVEAAAE
jgi:large subunit ribosomal protein L31